LRIVGVVVAMVAAADLAQCWIWLGLGRLGWDIEKFADPLPQVCEGEKDRRRHAADSYHN
jgi:hypothetical protein